LVRALDGAEVSHEELDDLAFEADGDLEIALNEAYVKPREFANVHELRLNDPNMDRSMRSELKDCLGNIVKASSSASPYLRGHYLSERRRGDVDYVGQLEYDLIRFLRGRGLRGPVTLSGHSSGGGLAIRFAGGGHGDLVSSCLLLSPVVPTSPAVKGGTGQRPCIATHHPASAITWHCHQPQPRHTT
jgi:hypothetical protein